VLAQQNSLRQDRRLAFAASFSAKATSALIFSPNVAFSTYMLKKNVPLAATKVRREDTVASREGDVGAGLVANFHALRCHPPAAPDDPDIVVVKHGVILKGVALKECRELRRGRF